MGRRAITGGAIAKGRRRIQFDFRLNGVRYRPTLKAMRIGASFRATFTKSDSLPAFGPPRNCAQSSGLR